MFKHTSIILLLSAVFVGCADDQGTGSKSSESAVSVSGRLCVPVEYVIRADDAGFPTESDGPNLSGLSVGIAISASEVSESVNQYAAEMRVGDKNIPQDLFVMFKPKSIIWKEGGNDYAHPIAGADGLVRRDSSSLAWTVTSGDVLSAGYWGSCTDYFEEAGKFECLRQHQFEGLVFEYTIESENIKLYSQVDQFLVEKFSAWKCP